VIVAAADSGKFSISQITFTTVVVGMISFPLALWLLRPRSWIIAAVVTLVAMAATFGWRLCAKMPDLNNDGVPGYSANDLAAPMFTWVLLGVVAAIQHPTDAIRYGRVRAVLAAVALAVNVITI